MPALAPLFAAATLLWQALQPGAWLEQRRMAAEGPLAPVRAILLKLDPRQVRFELVSETRDQGTRGAWTVERMPEGAVAALNAGQFSGGWAWGWLVRAGREEQPPGAGTLGMAFVVDSAGAVSLVTQGELPRLRAHVRDAFQSYPELLAGAGELPWELAGKGRGADLDHRDSRLALGTLPDGSVLVALTRFTGLGAAGEKLPYGPTTGEMATFMRGLGCVRAVLLDGGISSQMAVRARDGRTVSWNNWRPVPLALVVWPRGVAAAGDVRSPARRRRW